jgi:catechol 2,3-dioxygenase-like lactoylglutathione lyase family enzyme
MITALDHVVLIVRDLATSIRTYETLLGISVAWLAKADGAEMAVFTLANMSLELMAPASDQDGVAGERLRAALDRDGEGLASIGFRASDLAALHRRLTRLDLAPEPITEAESVNLLDGKRLQWRRTRAATEKTHGVRLFFLEWQAERPRSAALSLAPMVGLDHVVVGTRQPERAAALYGARLKLDMALDRTNPAWGSRLMFFRCGDLIVEIAHRLDDTGDAPDKIFGLSWRADDIDGARARLAATGLDVSEVRDGRKPGTRVFTVRDGPCGVPTLVLKPSPPRDSRAAAAAATA